MTITVTHSFSSTIPDDPDALAAGEVTPSRWNAAHVVTGAVEAPASSTDNAIARFNGTSGQIQNSLPVITDTGEIQAPGGTAAAPVFSFISDADTGMYRIGANQIGFATGGVLRATIDSNGISLTSAAFDALLGSTPNLFAVRGASVWAQRAIVGADLPNPSTTTLGGVFSNPVSANEVLSGIANDGTPTRATTTGTGNVVRAADASMSGTLTLTSTSASGFVVGRLGATNPAFRVKCDAANIVNGFEIQPAATGGVPIIAAIGSDTDIAFGFSSKGSASFLLYTRSTGSIGFQLLDSGGVNARWLTVTGGTGGGNATLGATSGSIAVTAPLVLSTALATASGGTALNAASDTAATFVNRALSVQNTGDTNDSASGSGAYRAYNLTYTIPANFLVANRVLRISAHFRLTTGSTPPVLDIQLKIGGTVVSHFQPNSVVVSGTNKQYGLQWMVQGTAAPSASSATETVMFGNSNAPGSLTTASDTAQPVNLATNATLAITIETQWATAGVGTNQIKLSQLVVEAIN
jgi:hypothetical protein